MLKTEIKSQKNWAYKCRFVMFSLHVNHGGLFHYKQFLLELSFEEHKCFHCLPG